MQARRKHTGFYVIQVTTEHLENKTTVEKVDVVEIVTVRSTLIGPFGETSAEELQHCLPIFLNLPNASEDHDLEEFIMVYR